MANGNLTEKYYVKRASSDSWTDVTSLWSGVKVLAIDGFNEMGDAVNVFTQQWTDSQTEDFLVTTQDGQGNDVVVRQNADLQMTLIVSRRYASSAIDEQAVFNSVKAYMDGGAFYVKSAYTGLQVRVICTKGFKPTTQKLQRGSKSYILATIPLHCLEASATAT